jgi:Kef-type K+ transport system membrane component KefB
MTEHQLFLYLAEVATLVVVARIGGELAVRLGIPQVVGELLLGICVGPSLFGALWPGGFNALFPADLSQRNLLEVTYWIGVVFLVVLGGTEMRVWIIRRAQSPVIGAWIGGFGLPFLLGFGLGWLVPRDLIGAGISRPVFALFIGTAMSISAIPVIARILMDLNLLKTKVGTIIMSSAVADDTVGWIVLAIVTGLASATHAVDKGTVLTALVGTALFVVFAFTIGQRLVDTAIRGSTHLKAPYMQTTLMLAIVFTAAAFTQWIHVHLVLGAFVAGILIARSKERRVMKPSRDVVREVGFAFFIPFFFGYTGVKTDFTTLTGHVLPVALAAVVVACLGKLVGASLGARIGGLSTWEALGVGSGLNARGAMELVIAGIGLSIGVLTEPMYSTIVLIAVVTTVMAGPMVRFCSTKYPYEATSDADSELEIGV